MFKKFVLLLFVVFCFSCEKQNELEKKIEAIPLDFKVLRFDQELANAQVEDLPRLKKEFPYLFPKQFNDSVWVEQLTDSIQDELQQEVVETFPDFSEQEDKLRQLFQHLKYYFPKFEEPTVVTVISEVDYLNKVIATDSLLLISLDTYLGKDHRFYGGIQDFFKKNFETSQIIPDVAEAYAQQMVSRPKSRSFLADMIYHGKILYLKDLLIPKNSDAEKIGYTQNEINWAMANEEQIWQFFIEQELLFKTDPHLQNRFLEPAPFSKFYLQLDAESPDRLGRYIGWQIVRKYMEENEDLPVKQLLIADTETIFNQANYKPRK